ncbi:MAG: hypothetical protein AAGA96_12525 [Verrucomicrobiota bacterium]
MNLKSYNSIFLFVIATSAFGVGWYLSPENSFNESESPAAETSIEIAPIDIPSTVSEFKSEEQGKTLLYDPSLAPSQQILSRKQVRDLLTELKANPNRNEEQLILDRLLLGMTPENAATIWPAFEKTFDGKKKYQYFMRLGELNGLSVLDRFSTDLTSWQLGGVLGGWAKVDLNSAYAYWQAIDPESKDYLELTKGLVHGWAALDPGAATEFVVELMGEGHRGKFWILLNMVRKQNWENSMTFEDQMAWAESITSSQLSRFANGDVMRTLVGINPLVAAEWARQQDSIITEQGVNIATQLSKYDPEAAITYARSHDPGERQNMLRAVADQLAEENPEAAIAMIQTTTDYIEGDLSNYDKAFEAWGAKDPLSAINWIEQNIPEDAYWDDQASAYHHTLKSWASNDPVAAGDFLNERSSDVGFGWGASGMAEALKSEDAASALQWAALNPRQGWRDSQIYDIGKRYAEENRDGATQALEGLGVEPELIAEILD